MHLKSENGAIDVLVCPEDEPQCNLHSPLSTTSGVYVTPGGVKPGYSEIDSSACPPSTSGELIQQPAPLPPPPQQEQSSLTLHSTQLMQQHQLQQQQQQQQQQLQQQQQQHYHHLQQQCLANPPQSGSAKLDDGSLTRQHNQARVDVGRTVATSSYSQVSGSAANELDISLSSAAEVGPDDLGFMDRLLPLDMVGVFDHLSPTLHTTEDFSFSLDEDNEGIQDLFDI